MKKYMISVSILLALCGVWTGCGKKAATGDQLFNEASPEIKQAWEQASAADKANDYVTAITAYRKLALQRDKLSHEQIVAVNEAMSDANMRLSEAFKQGDAAAKEAYGKLFQTQPTP